MSDTPQGLTCPITGCPVKHILIATVAVFAVTFAFDWLYHGVYLKDMYEATAAIWRPKAEMDAMMGVCLVYHAVLAFGVSALYCMMAKNCACGGGCPKTGMRFGLLLGLVIGIVHFSSYIWLPISMDLALRWLGGAVVWGVLTGYVLSLVKSKCCCKK